MLGINPRKRLDAEYFGYIELLTGQISSAIGTAASYEAEKQRAESLAEIGIHLEISS